MQAALAALFIFLICLAALLVLGPLIAGIIALLMAVILVLVSVPVLVILSPWLIIGIIAWKAWLLL